MKRRLTLIFAAILLLILCLVLWFTLRPGSATGADRLLRLRAWLANPAGHPEWTITAGERCGDAPMLMPTSGYIGFGRGDSFRPGHSHSGYDIFTPAGANNVTPVVAAYDGFLTREATWKSAVILRHPDFPNPDQQIWTYYTHMASADGEASYIDAAFPPGSREVFVKAGTLLGYQGNWSGRPSVPTGIHLHFSVVKSTPSGGYANETAIENTLDPGPLLGVVQGEDGVFRCKNPNP